MKWQSNSLFGLVGAIVSGVFIAFGMVQPKMNAAELMMYGATTVFVWVRLIVIILIVTWGYKYFKHINDIK